MYIPDITNSPRGITATPFNSPAKQWNKAQREALRQVGEMAKKRLFKENDLPELGIEFLKNKKLAIESTEEETPVFDGAAPPDFTGQATLHREDGGIYNGDIKNGLCDGIGTLTYPNRTYTGYWKNDKLHGLVELTFKEGGSYIGHWENGKRQNRGMLTYPDGTYYAGDWKSGMRHGYGIRTAPDGTFYKGLWKEDKRHGPGVRTHADGSVFLGWWSEDKRDGQGTLFHADGRVETIYYENGKIPDSPKSNLTF